MDAADDYYSVGVDGGGVVVLLITMIVEKALHVVYAAKTQRFLPTSWCW